MTRDTLLFAVSLAWLIGWAAAFLFVIVAL
jgi:hypothetical protein